MAVISGTEKDKLIDLLEERGVKFYHACQWADFKSYCIMGGIPSRGLMEANNLSFTKFDTDDKDKVNGVWNFVFGNLIDSGFHFSWYGKNESHVTTPNIFGPILFVFDPAAFRDVENVGIALRSAGGKKFNRDLESLSTVEEVNTIFTHENIEDAPEERARAYVKFTDKLGANPEVSCFIEDELLPFKYLVHVIVDDVNVNGKSLMEYVRNELFKNKIDRSVILRPYKTELGRAKLLSTLVNSLVSPKTNSEKNKIELKEWQERLEQKRAYQYNRFMTYFIEGTINVLNNEDEFTIFNLPPPFFKNKR